LVRKHRFEMDRNKNCVFQASTFHLSMGWLNAQLNLIEPNNGHGLSTTDHARSCYTGERLLRERPKIYSQVVRRNAFSRRGARKQRILFACRDFNEAWTWPRQTRNRHAVKRGG